MSDRQETAINDNPEEAAMDTPIFPAAERGIRSTPSAPVPSALADAEAERHLLGPSSSGADLITAERRRQIETERWTPDHDDEHEDGALLAAAACYLDDDRSDSEMQVWTDIVAREEETRARLTPRRWPWHPTFWRPTPNDRIRELVKAGALIAAEIDRLQRVDNGRAIAPGSSDQNGSNREGDR